MTLLLGGILIYHSHTCYNMTFMLNLSISNFWKLFFEAPYEGCALNIATLISFGKFNIPAVEPSKEGEISVSLCNKETRFIS